MAVCSGGFVGKGVSVAAIVDTVVGVEDGPPLGVTRFSGVGALVLVGV